MIVNEGGGGKPLPKLTNPGTADDLAIGYQLIDQDGNVINGICVTAGQMIYGTRCVLGKSTDGNLMIKAEVSANIFPEAYAVKSEDNFGWLDMVLYYGPTTSSPEVAYLNLAYSGTTGGGVSTVVFGQLITSSGRYDVRVENLEYEGLTDSAAGLTGQVYSTILTTDFPMQNNIAQPLYLTYLPRAEE